MPTPTHVDVAYYWSGTKWRATPILFSLEWTEDYFRKSGWPMVFGVKGFPPKEPPSETSTSYSVRDPR